MKKILILLIAIFNFSAWTQNYDFIESAPRHEEQRNTHSVQRSQTFKSWYFSLGPALPLSKAYAKRNIHIGLQGGHLWDAESANIEALVHFNFNGSSPFQYYAAGSLGGNYFFYESKQIGTYAGAQLGLAMSEDDSSTPFGFHYGIQGGAVLLRSSDVNLNLRIQATGASFKLNNKYPFWLQFGLGLNF